MRDRYRPPGSNNVVTNYTHREKWVDCGRNGFIEISSILLKFKTIVGLKFRQTKKVKKKKTVIIL